MMARFCVNLQKAGSLAENSVNMGKIFKLNSLEVVTKSYRILLQRTFSDKMDFTNLNVERKEDVAQFHS